MKRVEIKYADRSLLRNIAKEKVAIIQMKDNEKKLKQKKVE